MAHGGPSGSSGPHGYDLGRFEQGRGPDLASVRDLAWPRHPGLAAAGSWAAVRSTTRMARRFLQTITWISLRPILRAARDSVAKMSTPRSSRCALDSQPSVDGHTFGGSSGRRAGLRRKRFGYSGLRKSKCHSSTTPTRTMYLPAHSGGQRDLHPRSSSRRYSPSDSWPHSRAAVTATLTKAGLNRRRPDRMDGGGRNFVMPRGFKENQRHADPFRSGLIPRRLEVHGSIGR